MHMHVQGFTGCIETALSVPQVNNEMMSLDCTTVERQQNEHHREIMQGYFQDFKTTKAKMKHRSARRCGAVFTGADCRISWCTMA